MTHPNTDQGMTAGSIGELAAAIRVNLYRHAPDMPNYPVGIVEEVLRRALSTPPETVAAPIPVGEEAGNLETAAAGLKETGESFKVIQADRDALAQIDDALGFLMDNEREIVLHAFARHRLTFSRGVDERAQIIAWLRDDAGKTRDDLRRLPAARKLTRGQTAEWEALIAMKAGIAEAIERGDHLSTIEEPRG